jgi:hypothetical protein
MTILFWVWDAGTENELSSIVHARVQPSLTGLFGCFDFVPMTVVLGYLQTSLRDSIAGCSGSHAVAPKD